MACADIQYSALTQSGNTITTCDCQSGFFWNETLEACQIDCDGTVVGTNLGSVDGYVDLCECRTQDD